MEDKIFNVGNSLEPRLALTGRARWEQVYHSQETRQTQIVRGMTRAAIWEQDLGLIIQEMKRKRYIPTISSENQTSVYEVNSDMVQALLTKDTNPV